MKDTEKNEKEVCWLKKDTISEIKWLKIFLTNFTVFAVGVLMVIAEKKVTKVYRENCRNVISAGKNQNQAPLPIGKEYPKTGQGLAGVGDF